MQALLCRMELGGVQGANQRRRAFEETAKPLWIQHVSSRAARFGLLEERRIGISELRERDVGWVFRD